MAEDDTGEGQGQPSDPFPTGPDPFFQPTKAKQKKATKEDVRQADPNTKALGKGFNPRAGQSRQDDTLDIGNVAGEGYKFSPVDNPEGNIEDYTETSPTGTEPMRELGMAQQGGLLQASADPKTLSAKEYDALTREASKGNKLAQSILVSGHYKAHDYPSLQQDLKKVEDPFVNALSGLPALAENLQSQQQQMTQPYDFNNAEAQVNNLLGQMGSSQRMSASPETQAYVDKLQGIVGGANNINTSTAGLPSIEQALGGLGPAGKLSEKASPYASLLAALLSHQQYETIYGGQAPSGTNDPAWLQNLIASVTGTSIGGGLVNPSVAAGSVGVTPSTSATPTGSNG